MGLTGTPAVSTTSHGRTPSLGTTEPHNRNRSAARCRESNAAPIRSIRHTTHVESYPSPVVPDDPGTDGCPSGVSGGSPVNRDLAIRWTTAAVIVGWRPNPETPDRPLSQRNPTNIPEPS